ADAAIAALCLPDMVVSRQWPGRPSGVDWLAFDPTLKFYARADQVTVSVRQVEGDREIGKIAVDDLASYLGLIFSANGRYLHIRRISSSPRSQLYQIGENGVERLLADEHTAVAFNPNSRLMAAWYPDHSLRIVDLPGCVESKRFE